MMKRRIIVSLLAALILLSCLPVYALAAEDGFQTINGGYYYFENGNLLRSQWIGSGEYRYYVDNTGRALEGLHVINGKTYYFKEYPMCTLQTGWQTVNGQSMYFDPQTGEYLPNGTSGTQTPDTPVKDGFQTVDGGYYYYQDGKLLTNQWIGGGEKKYYVDGTGRAVEGLRSIDGKTYYFKEYPACTVQYGWHTVNGKHMFFDVRTGELLQVDGGTQIPDTTVTPDGFQTIANGYYYYENGKMLKNRWIGSGEWKYYVDSTGRAVEGLQTIDGKTYYFKEYPLCTLQYGWQTVNGQSMLFDTKTGELRQLADTGTGSAAPETTTAPDGFQTINNGFYYYENGKLLRNRWIGQKDWRYYVDATGRAVEGLKAIDGKTYYFKEYPWCNVQYGQQKVNGQTLFFDEQTGELRRIDQTGNGTQAPDTSPVKDGFQTINNGYYYYENGKLLKNQWIGSGEWKYYVDGTGRAVEGLRTINGATYYFKPYPWCNLQYGMQQVNGQTLFFNRQTGALETATSSGDLLTVTINGSVVTGPRKEILASVVMAEVGGFNQIETLKAQAVATYTWIKYQQAHGNPAPEVPAALSSPTALVYQAVEAVLGQTITYNGAPILAQYTASVGKGWTNNAQDAGWTQLPYLRSVASPYDSRSEGMFGAKYEVKTVVTKAQMMAALNAIYDNDEKNPEPIDFTTDPAKWITYEANSKGCAGRMNIAIKRLGPGESRTYRPKANYFKENSGLNIRSADFIIEYNGNETWTLTTYGFGHGVGMSQWGAYFYATIEGKNYKDILMHYYPGTQISG